MVAYCDWTLPRSIYLLFASLRLPCLYPIAFVVTKISLPLPLVKLLVSDCCIFLCVFSAVAEQGFCISVLLILLTPDFFLNKVNSFPFVLNKVNNSRVLLYGVADLTPTKQISGVLYQSVASHRYVCPTCPAHTYYRCE